MFRALSGSRLINPSNFLSLLFLRPLARIYPQAEESSSSATFRPSRFFTSAGKSADSVPNIRLSFLEMVAIIPLHAASGGCVLRYCIQISFGEDYYFGG
jgi:hypothetical protein